MIYNDVEYFIQKHPKDELGIEVVFLPLQYR